MTLRRHQITTLSLLFLAGLVNILDRSSLSVANSSVRAEMHLDATQMGWLLSAFALAYGLAQIPLVGLMQRGTTRSVLGTGLFVWSAAQMLTGLVQSLPGFLAMRVLLGTGEAPFYPCVVMSIREWFGERARGRATALVNSAQTIGLALAPPILTELILTIGWRKMFVLLGACGVAVAALWVALHRSRGATEFAVPESAASTPGDWRLLLRQRTAWGMVLGWGGLNYAAWLYVTWLPGYLQVERHLSLAKSGWVAAIPFLAGTIGMYCSGGLTDRLARAGVPLVTVLRRNLVGGLTVSALSTFLVAHAGSTAQAVAGMSFALFCIHFAGTSGWGYVQEVCPPRYVASLGAMQNSGSFIIASAGPVLTGFLLDRTHSFDLALTACAAVTLLGALSYATLAAPDGMRLET
jgi:MFS family permease